MIHYYTYGKDGKRGIFLTETLAGAFNRFTRSFFDAQKLFEKENGRKITVDDLRKSFFLPMGGPGQLRDEEDLDLYHRFARIATIQYWIRNNILHLPNKEEHATGDFLVKKF